MSEPIEGEVVEPGRPRGGGRPGGHPRIPTASDVRRWSRMWMLPVAFGVAGVVLGVLVIAWPGHTVKALTVLFGVYLVITGGYRLVAAIQLKNVDPVARMVALVLAVLSVGFGAVCLAHPFNAAATLALVIGLYWLVSGALSIFGARQRVRAALRRAPSMGGGLFAMFIGLLILLFPGASLVVLAWILGLWLIFFGTMAVVTGLAARKLLTKAKYAAALYWP